MPSFITSELYACGHVQETCNRAFGPDASTRRIVETLPLPNIRCLPCICQSVLDASTGGLGAIPASYVRDLGNHLQNMRRQLRGTGNVVMGREMDKLVARLQRCGDVAEFRRGIVALAGLPAVSGQTVAVC